MKKRLLDERECMKAQYVLGGDVLYDDVRELNYTFAYDRHIMRYPYCSVAERSGAYDAITPERIREIACAIFRPENLVLTMKGEKKKIDTKKIEKILDEFAKE